MMLLFKRLARKANIQGIYVICVSTVQVQPGEFAYPIPTNTPVLQPCIFHMIFLILYFSLAIDDYHKTRTRLIFRYGL